MKGIGMVQHKVYRIVMIAGYTGMAYLYIAILSPNLDHQNSGC